jgi:hypothetical protein
MKKINNILLKILILTSVILLSACSGTSVKRNVASSDDCIRDMLEKTAKINYDLINLDQKIFALSEVIYAQAVSHFENKLNPEEFDVKNGERIEILKKERASILERHGQLFNDSKNCE